MNDKRTQLGKTILRWWGKNLQPESTSETSSLRAFRAHLRHADCALEVMIKEECVTLYHELYSITEERFNNPSLVAALLRVLAHVKAHHDTSANHIARRFGNPASPGKPAPLSPLRFQKLIRLDDFDALAVALRRNLPLIEGNCNVAALGTDFLCWFSKDQTLSESIRTRWCFEYFGRTFSPTQQPIA